MCNNMGTGEIVSAKQNRNKGIFNKASTFPLGKALNIYGYTRSSTLAFSAVVGDARGQQMLLLGDCNFSTTAGHKEIISLVKCQ